MAGRLDGIRFVPLGRQNCITFNDTDGDGRLGPGDTIELWGREGGGLVGSDGFLSLFHTSLNKIDRIVLTTRMVPGR